MYVGGDTAGAFLQVRGKGVYTYDAVRLIFSDSTSITTNGTRPYTIEFKYSDIPSIWTDLGDALVGAYKDPQTSCDTIQLYANRDTHNMALFLFTEPRDYIPITDTLTAYDSSTWNSGAGVQGVTWEVRGNKQVFWTIKHIF